MLRYGALSGFSSYDWSNGANSEIISVITSGFYSVIVTDTNFCLGYSDTVMVGLYNSAIGSVITGNNFVEISDNEDYCINVASNSSYIWGFPAGTINSGQGTNCINLSFLDIRNDSFENLVSKRLFLFTRNVEFKLFINSNLYDMD